MKLPLGVSENFWSCFACFLKEQPRYVNSDVSPPLPTAGTVIHFSAYSAELDCIMHSTHVCRQKCVQVERTAETSKSPFRRPDFISQVHQRWVVHEVRSSQFSRIAEARCCWAVAFQSCAQALPAVCCCNTKDTALQAVTSSGRQPSWSRRVGSAPA